MPFSAFSRPGNGFRCSSRRPPGKVLFDQIKQSHGGAYQDEAFEGPVVGRWFALAMTIARVQSTLERAKNQADPLKAYNLLKNHLHDYGVQVDHDATLGEMRTALAAAMQLPLGPRRGNVEYQLQTALGDDFVAWVTTPASEDTVYPTNPWGGGAFGVLQRQGIFNNPPAWKTVRIPHSIAFTLPSGAGVQTVAFEEVSGDSGPLVVGDRLVVAPGKLGQQELVVVLARTDTTFNAFFRRPHEANEVAIRRPWPFWMSTAKHSLVVVKHGRARDRVLRDKVRRLLHKLLGATSTWDVVEENSTPGTTGGFLPGVGEPGITPIVEVTL